MKTNGFVNVTLKEDRILCEKPTYEIGSSAKLNFASNNVKNVWKVDDTVDDDVETIDPDNLLDEDDLKKPDPASLKGEY